MHGILVRASINARDHDYHSTPPMNMYESLLKMYKFHLSGQYGNICYAIQMLNRSKKNAMQMSVEHQKNPPFHVCTRQDSKSTTYPQGLGVVALGDSEF